MLLYLLKEEAHSNRGLVDMSESQAGAPVRKGSIYWQVAESDYFVTFEGLSLLTFLKTSVYVLSN